MNSRHSHRRRSAGMARSLQAALLVGSLLGLPTVYAAEPGANEHQAHPGHASAASMPGWTQTLKGQTIVEESLEGRGGRSEKVELQHHRLMRQMDQQLAGDAQAQWTSGGYNGMSMMHQYMGQDGSSFLLMSDNKAEPVGMDGGKCPAGVPVKHYDVSMINAEITLNRWQDFYPGYMYVLTENIEKVRAEEAKNKTAREAEWDPGAVSTGLQGDIIQPLVIRGNQGDCVRITLRNRMNDEAGSLHIHGSSMVISASGKAATTTNPDSVVEPGHTTEMEWYLYPGIQEGVRQFHSYSNDRELTVMGLFGAFVVEPKGSRYLEPIGTGTPTDTKSGWQVIIDTARDRISAST
jgi:hypothetical protein